MAAFGFGSKRNAQIEPENPWPSKRAKDSWEQVTSSNKHWTDSWGHNPAPPPPPTPPPPRKIGGTHYWKNLPPLILEAGIAMPLVKPCRIELLDLPVTNAENIEVFLEKLLPRYDADAATDEIFKELQLATQAAKILLTEVKAKDTYIQRLESLNDKLLLGSEI